MKKSSKNIQIKNYILKLFTILSIIFTIHVVFSNPIKATTKLIMPEYNENYKKWQKLSDEEKENYIEPSLYSITYDKSTQIFRQSRLAMFASLKSTYPEHYEIDDLTVKNQMDTNECWAFTATTVLESNFQKLENTISPLYSPRHMDYSNSNKFANGTNPNGYNRDVS